MDNAGGVTKLGYDRLIVVDKDRRAMRILFYVVNGLNVVANVIRDLLRAFYVYLRARASARRTVDFRAVAKGCHCIFYACAGQVCVHDEDHDKDSELRDCRLDDDCEDLCQFLLGYGRLLLLYLLVHFLVNALKELA